MGDPKYGPPGPWAILSQDEWHTVLRGVITRAKAAEAENETLRAALLEFCAMCCLTPKPKTNHCARGPSECPICAAWPLLAPSNSSVEK